jgi:hypothetical protein
MKTRNRPAPRQERRPSRHHNAASEFIAYRRQDGWAAPTPEDRADLDVLIAAAERGFRLATRCTRCSKWVVSRESVMAHMGPVCRAKAARK